MRSLWKILAAIGGVLAAVFIGGFLVDRRHTYEARRQQLKKRRLELETEAHAIDESIGTILQFEEDKHDELEALEAQRAAIHTRADRLRKSEVSYEKALARLGHDPSDWDQHDLGG